LFSIDRCKRQVIVERLALCAELHAHASACVAQSIYELAVLPQFLLVKHLASFISATYMKLFIGMVFAVQT